MFDDDMGAPVEAPRIDDLGLDVYVEPCPQYCPDCAQRRECSYYGEYMEED